jgi:ketosteroid isomerase-like protein
MPLANLDLVCSLHAAFERGEFSSNEWADPEIEFEFADGPDPGSWVGVAAMGAGWRAFQSPWEDFRIKPIEYRELDDERVLVLVQFLGRAKTSGMQLGQMSTKNAGVWHIRDGKVARVVFYWDRERALADLGLTGGAS